MKISLALLALSLSAFQGEYVFHPEGNFTITVTEAGPYYFTGFQFQNGNIYSITEDEYVLYGTVEKLPDLPETYAVRLNGPLSVRGTLSSGENYEIFDERGVFIGHIRGDFSTHSSGSFLFLDRESRPFATAALDPSHSTITIYSSEGSIFCSKTFQYPGFTADPHYYWTIQGASISAFDTRYLWPFIALASELWWRQPNMGGYY